MFALVDCNNFYCSCERVFNPALNGRPVIVLSNNDGCAIARSEEAKAIGIQMAAPEYLVRDLIRAHGVAVFSSNYSLYGDMSDRVMRILSRFVPTIELYSIDEAFLDLSALPYADPVQLGVDMRRTVGRETGIPITVGIASTKTLAKLANRFAKKHRKDLGVHWLGNAGLVAHALHATPVGDVWGIGPQHAKLLVRHGVETAADFISLPDDWVRRQLSVVGLRVLTELRGTPAIAWELEPARKKNICTSRSFGKLIESKELLAEAIANFAASCAGKLRAEGSCAKSVNTFINTNPFRTADRQHAGSITLEMDVATSDSAEIVRYALKGLDIIYRDGFKFMKAGVVVADIVPEDVVQGSLFDEVDRQRSKRLMHTLDSVNRSMGRDVVRLAVQGFEKRYRLRQEHLSQRYTTNIHEVLHVKN